MFYFLLLSNIKVLISSIPYFKIEIRTTKIDMELFMKFIII